MINASHPLLTKIRACRLCEQDLPLGANPVLNFTSKAKVMIVGQAPGTKVHHSSIPWNDASGQRLRTWLGISAEEFYNPQKIAIVPMGFCYPGRGKSGDLPPRKECAHTWMSQIIKVLKHRQLTLLIGQYAINYFLGSQRCPTLTETVKNWQNYLPNYIVLPHPSPRNNIWLKKNPWFEGDMVPSMQLRLSKVLQNKF